MASHGTPPASGTVAERDSHEGLSRIADVSSEPEGSRGQSGSTMAPVFKTYEERMKSIEQLNFSAYAKALQQETDQLLAAGFSHDRIEWLRSRTDELEAVRRRADTERRQRGVPVSDPNEGLAYFYDSDLDLVKEIGAGEYERYREALGRPNSVAIATVKPGGIADTYGLKGGDRIVRYDGKRVYNIAQVNLLTHKNVRDPNEGKPGEFVTVEVMRDGQPLSLTVLKGDLSIGTALPPPHTSRLLRQLVQGQGTQP